MTLIKSTLMIPSELMMIKERKQRARSYVIWNLQRDFANLSALVEAAVLEARHLISHKAQQQMLPAAELNEAERQHLERERRKRLAEITHRSGLALVKAVHGHKWAYPFNAPVDVNAFPNYAQIVKTPMDLGTIKQHLESGNHYKDPNEVWADVCLVFENAKRYNTLGSDVYLMAEMVEEFAQERYEKVLAPKIAEESAQATREEVTAKRRQADLLNAAAATAAEQQCMRLLSLVDELLFSIKEAKSRAAAACQGASQEICKTKRTKVAGRLLPTQQW
ncbi:Bromodomain-containing protein [Dunaliella salina]|uniref:Bromodomain-containing protein n=1 Tax=Dunaliella salina TaxID=3046 RepID=A0ABQ7FXN6_DUNSA|nr:Bromodomain-containing protein [Dunaliella salina]|eukprot:KAF5827118.1 Bromodomain-containing protein [Dunaliella salina]